MSNVTRIVNLENHLNALALIPWKVSEVDGQMVATFTGNYVVSREEFTVMGEYGEVVGMEAAPEQDGPFSIFIDPSESH